MVLEEATALAEAPFADTTPASDLDPYAVGSDPTYIAGRSSSFLPVNPPGNDQVYVNLNNLPKPWTIFSDRGHSVVLARSIEDSCRLANSVLDRPVRQEEADAFAFHLAKSIQVGSIGTPLGASLASVQAYRGWKDYRFPGWKPGETFNPNKFWFLTGFRANAMWHVLRLNAYWIVGAVMGQIFFGSYALTVGLAGRVSDPRLEDFNEAIRERQKAGMKIQVPKREVDTTAAARQGETFEMAAQRRSAQETLRRDQRREPQGDDMSPTGGAFGQDFLGGSGETGILNDSQAQQWEGRHETKARTSSRDKAAPSVPDDSSRSSASQSRQPTDASTTVSGGSTPKVSGSAWERLRQQAASGQPSSQAPGSRRSPTSSTPDSGGDSFSFLQGEEEKQLAKSEAQKEFDARAERERAGVNFDDKAQGRGRW